MLALAFIDFVLAYIVTDLTVIYLANSRTKCTISWEFKKLIPFKFSINQYYILKPSTYKYHGDETFVVRK